MSHLSSEERMERLYRGEWIDRVPMFSSATMYAGRQMGLSSEEFYFDMEKSFQAQKKVCEEHRYDDTPCYDLPHGEMLDLGGKLRFARTGSVELPMVEDYPIHSLEEAWDYELPSKEEMKFTRLQIEFLKYAETQGQMGVPISAGSPFTMVGSMMDTDLFMRWIVKEPEVIRRLLKLAIEYLSRSADMLIQEFGLERCAVSSYYPFESNQLISARIFEKFAYPAMMEVHKVFREKGLTNFGIHICGDHNQTLEYFKDLNLEPGSMISSDEKNSMVKVAGVFGEDYLYAGNVSSMLLVQGTTAQVYQQSREIIEAMKFNKAGFILMPSCDLPINTKPENLDAMLQAACDFGKY